MAFGVDWHGRNKLSDLKAIDRAKVTGLTPVSDVPLYTDSAMKPLVLPKNLLQSRQWYSMAGTNLPDAELGPGQIVYAAKHDTATSKFLGELWIRYRVVMQGSCEV